MSAGLGTDGTDGLAVGLAEWLISLEKGLLKWLVALGKGL